MFKRITIRLLMAATLSLGTLGIAASSEAQLFGQRWYWDQPYYGTPSYYSYNYRAPTYMRWNATPYGYYYQYPTYGVPYYTARPQIQYYYYR